MHEIFLANCFVTAQDNSGNPAAVVINFTGDDSDRLAFAKKLGEPVTVFISDLSAKEPELKFFYPNFQTTLCIHGTLAAAKFLFSKTNKNALTCLTHEGEKLNLIKSEQGYLQLKVSQKKFAELNVKKETVCKMLNLSNSNSLLNDLPFCISSVGSQKLLIPLDSLKSLSELKPNYEYIKTWSEENKINGIYVYTKEPSSTSNFYARGFNPKSGQNEDAATGVAAGALSLALKRNIKIEQGNFMGKPCVIVVEYISADNLLVGGKVSEIQRCDQERI